MVCIICLCFSFVSRNQPTLTLLGVLDTSIRSLTLAYRHVYLLRSEFAL